MTWIYCASASFSKTKGLDCKLSKLPFWSLSFGHLYHFSLNLKPFASGSLWFQFYCHFGPN
ncbi:hypothetical protein Hanom_Chr16g01460721 [Helianthus anomalus]